MRWNPRRYSQCVTPLAYEQVMVARVIVNRTQQEIPNEATMKDTEDKAVSVVEWKQQENC